MTSRSFAIIAGAGPGTGAALALRFAKTYPVVLLARSPESFNRTVDDILSQGGQAFGIAADVSSRLDLTRAYDEIRSKLGQDAACAAAVYNASARPAWKTFMEVTDEDFASSFTISGQGAFNFAQAAMPWLLQHTSKPSGLPPTLIFTGATASLRGSAMLSSFAPAKFATRALAQCLAREYGPRGVHVSHVVIDGMIDIPSSQELMADAGPRAKLDTGAIAEAYWQLHSQPLSAFTHELDLRPYIEKW